MTPYDDELAAGIASGALCPKSLAHGDPCGREVDTNHGVGLCQWHSEDLKELPHEGDEESGLIEAKPGYCRTCGWRRIWNRRTKLCKTCNRQLNRSLARARFNRGDDVVQGHIVET